MTKKYSLYIALATLAIFSTFFYATYSNLTTPLLVTTPTPTASSTEDHADTSSTTAPLSAPEAAPSQTSPTPTPHAMPDPRAVSIAVEGAKYVGVVPDGSTVLLTMRQLQSEGLRFEGRDYPSLGFFVESINGKKNDGGYYWFLYVNGKESKKGASQMEIHAGDTVEWKYEKSR